MFNLNYLQVFFPIFSFIVNVITQVFVCRYIKKIGLLKSEFIGFIVGFLCLLFIELHYLGLVSWPLGKYTPYFFVNIAIYFCLWYCYFHFVNLGTTARRPRILRELCEVKDGLSMAEILERYNSGKIIEVRIKRLLDTGQIVCRNNRYYIGGRIMLIAAKLMVILKVIMLGKKSEFD